MRYFGLIYGAFSDFQVKGCLWFLGSVVLHAVLIQHLFLQNKQSESHQGGLFAPVAVNFLLAKQVSVSEPQAEVVPVEDLVKEIVPAEEIIEQSDPVKNASEPVIPQLSENQTLQEIPKKIPEPVKIKPESNLKEPAAEPRSPADSVKEPVSSVASVTELSDVHGLDDIPVVTTPAFRKPPSPPKYPRQAKRRNQQGVVLLEALVSDEGETLSVTVVESSGYPLLDRAAERAVSGWTFQPRVIGSRTVQSRVRIPVNFELQSG